MVREYVPLLSLATEKLTYPLLCRGSAQEQWHGKDIFPIELRR